MESRVAEESSEHSRLAGSASETDEPKERSEEPGTSRKQQEEGTENKDEPKERSDGPEKSREERQEELEEDTEKKVEPKERSERPGLSREERLEQHEEGTEKKDEPKERSEGPGTSREERREESEERIDKKTYDEEGPKYQDPRGAMTPSQPPIATGALAGACPVPGQAGSTEAHKPLGKDDKESAGAFAAQSERASASPTTEAVGSLLRT